MFWLLLLAVWGSLNLVFVSGDLFTLYVALELLTFAGVPLVCLDGSGETLRAALRYLLFALAGSRPLPARRRAAVRRVRHARHRAAGAAHAAVGRDVGGRRADDDGPARQDRAVPVAPLAAARARRRAGRGERGAVGAGGQGSFFLVIRLWFDAMPARIPSSSAAQLLGALGAAAILVGSVVALRQERLKLLIAYSTLAQIGYLFLMFPLAFDAARRESCAAAR